MTEDLNERIRFLEKELESLKEDARVADNTGELVRALRRINRFISSYQPLLTVMTAILTLVFLQMNFGYGTWASYRNASEAKETNRRLTDFYLQLGDRLVYDEEYDEAAKAYKSALALQPNDPRATYGLAKAQIFETRENQTYLDPELVRTKLDYLESLYKDDADIELIKCALDSDLDDNEAARSCIRAISLNPKLHRPYIFLGFICLKQFDFVCAQEHFRHAVENKPNSASANSNLGYSQLLQLNTKDAILSLEKAGKLSSTVPQLWALGDAYRYSSEIDKAIDAHENALYTVDQKLLEKEPAVVGDWLIVTMPLTTDDKQANGFFQTIDSIEAKRAVIRYALTIDYALKGNFLEAQREFGKAKEDDPQNQYGDYFVNRASVAARILKVNSKTRLWLKEKSRKACTPKWYCTHVDALYR